MIKAFTHVSKQNKRELNLASTAWRTIVTEWLKKGRQSFPYR